MMWSVRPKVQMPNSPDAEKSRCRKVQMPKRPASLHAIIEIKFVAEILLQVLVKIV